jgi:hypothetical protein
MQGSGVTLPFPILATITNVALQLSDEEAVDEEAVRKQVRRYEERLKRRKELEESGNEAISW